MSLLIVLTFSPMLAFHNLLKKKKKKKRERDITLSANKGWKAAGNTGDVEDATEAEGSSCGLVMFG